MAYPQYGGAPGYGAPPPQQGYGQPPPPGAPPHQPGYGQPPPPGMGGMGAVPGIDPMVYSWFAAVDADRSGQINAHELQQALTNSNWSHFNAETCRLMIGMFDRDFSGTINLQEFQGLWTYIQQWKGVFDQFDRDRSGAIEYTEYHNALNQMGYRVSPQFAHMVVTRYDHHGRRSLTLDNFIQSCVLLKSVTDTFRQRDVQGAGSVRLQYEDFMTMAMLNKP